MSVAKSLVEEQNLLTEFSTNDIVDSVIVAGSNNQVTLVDAVVEGMPDHVQHDIRIQRLVAEISSLEKKYTPLVDDLHHSRVFANPERFVVAAMFLLFVVGGIAAISFWIGFIALAVLVGLVAIYFLVQIRVVRGLRQEINESREQIVGKLNELRSVQTQLLAGSNG